MVALLTGLASAQEATALVAPDGTRFLLCPDATMPQVHWAIASWTDPAEDPPALPGLGRVVLTAAMRGTWNTGSRDVENEQRALAALDELWQQAGGSAEASVRAQITAATAAAEALYDPTVQSRQLAALPVHRFELEHRGPVSVLTLTTLAEALPEVAAMLLDRRERNALRGLPECWLARDTASPNALEAELLALIAADHPWLRLAVPRAMPRRDEATARFRESQRADRTLHVLAGDFDVREVTACLARTFQGARADAAPPRAAHVRPLAGVRRSQVPGITPATVLIAWPMPADVDRHALAITTQWLAEPESALAQELRRRGRSKVNVACQAPWPPSQGGHGLFVLRVRDDQGIDGLADLVLQSLPPLLTGTPTDADLAPVVTKLQQEWRSATADPRQQVAAFAAVALAWPRVDPADIAPRSQPAATVRALLQRICQQKPAIVEGRP